MAISPILVNGTIQQTNGVLQNHTRETQKAAMDQGNIYVQEQKKEQKKAHQVMDSDKSRFQQERYDAKEKGHGNYQGDGGKNRRHHEDEDGTVIEKSMGGFDIKI